MRRSRARWLWVVAVVVLGALGPASPGADAGQTAADPPEPAVVAHFHLSGTLTESPLVDPFGFMAGQVTSLVCSISDTLRSRYPEVLISAAVRPDPERAAADYGQEWIAWLKQGVIDFAAPMLYTTSTAKFFGPRDL